MFVAIAKTSVANVVKIMLVAIVRALLTFPVSEFRALVAILHRTRNQ